MLNWKKIIASEILDSTGFEVPVLVKELPELKEVLNNNTFLNKRIEDINFLHVTFFSHIPEQANIEKIKGNQYAQDEFIIAGKSVYLFCLKGYGNTKLNNNFFEKKLKVLATTGNWKTIMQLVNIAESIL